MIETKEFAIATKTEHIWIKAKEATIARIKQAEEGLTIDKAFLELCETKIKNENNKV